MASYYWQDLTTTELAALERDRAVVILPVGAIEQHGPHLPLSTDATIARAIVDAALAYGSSQCDLIALPSLDIGHSPEHTNFVGTLSLEVEALLQMWCSLAQQVHAAGFSKLLILNAHGGQRSIVDLAAVRLRAQFAMQVARVSYFSLGMPEGLFDAREVRLGIHGGEVETSLMLAIDERTVRTDQLRNFEYRDVGRAEHPVLGYEKPVGLGWLSEDLSEAGVVGNAAAADAQRGRRYLDYLAERLVGVCEAMPG